MELKKVPVSDDQTWGQEGLFLAREVAENDDRFISVG